MRFKRLLIPFLASTRISTTSALSRTESTVSTSLIEPPASLPFNTTTFSHSHLLSHRSFSSSSSSNIAVYFGQTPITSTTTLLAQCSDPSIDIVILAFIVSYLPSSSPSPSTANFPSYPTLNFGASCGGQTALMAASAPGLLYCEDLARDIQSCQKQYGKKVLVSLGGATAGIVLSDEGGARDLGDVLWGIFGPVNTAKVEMGLRPFGNVVVDGFDIDNENNNPQHYPTLATTLRAHFATDPSKPYFLSSAPQCPFPDASNPLELLHQCDFVWVQFYNNPGCEIGSVGFDASVEQWSGALKGGNGGGNGGGGQTRLFIGMPAFAAAGGSAWTGMGGVQGVENVVTRVKRLGLGNLGGVMFWDGPEGRANVEGGRSVVEWARVGLGASGTSGMGGGSGSGSGSSGWSPGRGRGEASRGMGCWSWVLMGVLGAVAALIRLFG